MRSVRRLPFVLALLVGPGCVVWDSRDLQGAHVPARATSGESGQPSAPEQAQTSAPPEELGEPAPDAPAEGSAVRAPADGAGAAGATEAEQRPSDELEPELAADPGAQLESERAPEPSEPSGAELADAEDEPAPSSESPLEPPSEPTTVEPKPAEAPAGETLEAAVEPGEGAVGARVLTLDGLQIGVVEDLWLAPADGKVVGVLVRHSVLELPGEPPSEPAPDEPAAIEAAAGASAPSAPDAKRLAELVVYQPLCVRWEGLGPDERLVLQEPGARSAQAVRERAELFAARKLETLEGVVDEVVPKTDCPDRVCIVRLRDASNVRHRVLLEPASSALALLPGLALDASVSVEAVSTRDASGKIWLAGSLKVGKERVRLRKEDGSLELDAFASSFLSARSLLASAARTQDGAELAVSGFVLERGEVSVSALRVRHGEVERLVAWSLLRPANGALGLALNETDLVTRPYVLPLVRPLPAPGEPPADAGPR